MHRMSLLNCPGFLLFCPIFKFLYHTVFLFLPVEIGMLTAEYRLQELVIFNFFSPNINNPFDHAQFSRQFLSRPKM